MILGIEDITGGPQIVAFLVWLALSALFYLVCYMAAMQVIDGWTGNSIAKIPVMFAAAIPSAALMAALDYSPLIIAVVMAVSNYFRVQNLAAKAAEAGREPPNKILHYGASYGYLILVPVLAFYLRGFISAP